MLMCFMVDLEASKPLLEHFSVKALNYYSVLWHTLFKSTITKPFKFTLLFFFQQDVMFFHTIIYPTFGKSEPLWWCSYVRSCKSVTSAHLIIYYPTVCISPDVLIMTSNRSRCRRSIHHCWLIGLVCNYSAQGNTCQNVLPWCGTTCET